MKRFLLSFPAAIHVYVEAESADAVDEDMAFEALLEQRGKYIEVDARSISGDFEILDEEDV